MPREGALAGEPCCNGHVVTPERLAQLRVSYEQGTLAEADLAEHPLAQFQRWFEEACAAGVAEPNAMVLATADGAGRPSARTVLLKGVDARGFVLFTNHTSRKGRELAVNPWASLVFPWLLQHRQVVVVGGAEPVTEAETAAYFSSRPRDSQLGAWISRQSAVIADREVLRERERVLRARFDEAVPVPPFWGGVLVRPETIEFWQGRASRLHDRLRYRWTGTTPAPDLAAPAGWTIERLSP